MYNGILKTQIEFLRKDNPELHKKVLLIYANTTKWKRELTEGETRALIEYIEEKLATKITC